MLRIKAFQTLFGKTQSFIRTKVLPNGNIKTQFVDFNKSTGLLKLETSVKKANGAFVYNSAGERNIVNGITESFGHYNKNWLEVGVPEELATFHISNLA